MDQSTLKPRPTHSYIVPVPGGTPEKELISITGPDPGRQFPFWERLVIGRLERTAILRPGVLYVADPAISSTHCIVTQDSSGRCFVRDMSLNGTRIDYRRLVPGTETEMRIGQVLTVGPAHDLRLCGQPAAPQTTEPPRGTRPMAAPVEVTVLVGDIRNYTRLVHGTSPRVLQTSVTAVIHELLALLGECGGSVKEIPGDAILAYWETNSSANCAVRACRAAFVLDAAIPRLAWDSSVWKLRPELLRMDWALATGKVMIGCVGGSHPIGLSMVGEPIVKAFRLEKIADERTGPVIACSRTRLLAQGAIQFRDLGAVSLEGFKSPEKIYAVDGAL